MSQSHPDFYQIRLVELLRDVVSAAEKRDWDELRDKAIDVAALATAAKTSAPPSQELVDQVRTEAFNDVDHRFGRQAAPASPASRRWYLAQIHAQEGYLADSSTLKFWLNGPVWKLYKIWQAPGLKIDSGAPVFDAVERGTCERSSKAAGRDIPSPSCRR